MIEPEDRPTKSFLCRYYHDGHWWAVTLQAYDFEDAEARAKKLSLQLEGELVFATSQGWFAVIACWLRNLFYR